MAEPTGLAEQVAWLVDRALIGDLLVEFARTLDAREWEAHVALYAPDGVFEIPGATRFVGHEELMRTASPRGLGQYAGTWHLSANHAITIDGYQARVRSYLIGVHLLGGGPADHADGGGWYDITLRRTDAGWRFATVRITEIWQGSTPLPHVG